MSNEATNPAFCQTAVRRRFIPIPYSQWFNSVHNKTKAFSYMSKESLNYYYRWCEYVSKTYAQLANICHKHSHTHLKLTNIYF